MNGEEAGSPLTRISLFAMALLILTIFALENPHITEVSGKAILIGFPWLAALYFGFEKATKVLGNPLSYDLSKYVRDLKYEDKVAFIDRFQNDFSDIVKSYVGDKGRVFVFIDDLDRCEVPRAADLLPAINLLLSADQGNLFFVIGLDREMVAAGIAAKNERVLPYITAGRTVSQPEKSDSHRIGIEYGYGFIEKFIQVPFRVPRPDQHEITRWVSELVKVDNQTIELPARSDTDSIRINKGSDPEEFQRVVEKIAQIFGFNPRSLKQFINVFRLRVMIALSTGILVPAQENKAGASRIGGITIHQLGLFTAIMMRWSPLGNDLMDEPTLFDRLASGGPPIGIVEKWTADNELRKVIKLDESYSLLGVDLRPLLMIMPDLYSGVLGERDPKQAKSRLVAGLGSSISANVSSNTSPRVAGASRQPPAFSIGTSSVGTSAGTGFFGPTGPSGPAR